MGRSWAASLILGAVVSAALVGVFHLTGFFSDKMSQLEEFYRSIFILPVEGPLKFMVPLQYGFITLMAYISSWVCIELPRRSSKIAFIIAAAFLTLLLSPILAFCGILFEPLSAVLAVVATGLGGIIFGHVDPGWQRHKLFRYFVGRVSTENFERLINAKDDSMLTGKRELTVLTCRILNYPDLANQMEPKDLEQLGSLFLQVTGEFMVAQGAYLDTCTADGVRVFFGMMDKNGGTHAMDACKSALELKQRLVNLDQEIQNRWHRKPAFGVALATGQMSVGRFGFREFEFYSAVGEPLDFSRRLCAVNLVYGSHLLISARTFHLTKEKVETRPMEMVYAPKLHQISEVYELLAEKGKLSDEESKARDAFWQGVVSLRKGNYKEAVQQLMQARIDTREDPPLKYFLERAEAGMKDETTPDTKGVSRHVRLLTVNP
ncbi:adenylate/guanylate cyclase domain-containing protein [Verrucomicrobium spinosum]|uniref:adenylate/guanylate cyclase domain-containing protein n=1 Tax=Verrucomicrobium spinosum TaxID=2736 RepID=UPI0018DB8CFE|nr:adenylate/guanylate cyclase domain-containing protein [Verrucomicrobium spinosum]